VAAEVRRRRERGEPDEGERAEDARRTGKIVWRTTQREGSRGSQARRYHCRSPMIRRSELFFADVVTEASGAT
jgi:hypothetical protein